MQTVAGQRSSFLENAANIHMTASDANHPLEQYIRCCATWPTIVLLQLAKLAMAACMGVLLPIYSLQTYGVSGDAPCDQPVGPWLLTFGSWGLFFGGSIWAVAVVQTPAAFILQSIAYRANGNPSAVTEIIRSEMSSNELTAQLLRASANASMFGGACNLPAVLFGLIWVVKGNFSVYGTSPNEALSAVATLVDRSHTEGCAPELLEGARRVILILNCATSAFLSCCCCTAMVMSAAAYMGTQAGMQSANLAAHLFADEKEDEDEEKEEAVAAPIAGPGPAAPGVMV